jgi:DNA polymerase III epsilon subunit family exonuclease
MTDIREPQTTLPEGLADLTFVAFDVETTGLSAIACKLVELSGVKFKLGTGQIDTFSTLINPCEAIPPEVSNLHGITDEMVANAPTVDLILPGFYEWCANSVMIAHNASFDVEFLKVHSMRQRIPLPANRVIDTLALAQVLVEGSANYKLKTLSEHFGFAGSLYHRALDDSMYVHKLFEKLVALGSLASWADVQRCGATFSFTEAQKYAAPVLSDQLKAYLDLINAAIEQRSELKLTYSSEFKSTRVVLPQAVIESRGSVYLSAMCRRSNAERTFRLDRIVEVTIHRV